MKCVLRVVFLSMLATCVSCIPSDNPLSDERTSTLDKRLLGRWKEVEEEGVFRVELPKESSHRLEAVQEKAEVRRPYDILTTELDGQRFLSLGIRKVFGGKFYLICKYEFADDDTLKAVGLSSEGETVLRRLLETKKLRGTVSTLKDVEKEVADISLAEPTESLRRFVEKNWRELFAETKENVVIYKRQK